MAEVELICWVLVAVMLYGGGIMGAVSFMKPNQLVHFIPIAYFTGIIGAVAFMAEGDFSDTGNGLLLLAAILWPFLLQCYFICYLQVLWRRVVDAHERSERAHERFMRTCADGVDETSEQAHERLEQKASDDLICGLPALCVFWIFRAMVFAYGSGCMVVALFYITEEGFNTTGVLLLIIALWPTPFICHWCVQKYKAAVEQEKAREAENAQNAQEEAVVEMIQAGDLSYGDPSEEDEAASIV